MTNTSTTQIEVRQGNPGRKEVKSRSHPKFVRCDDERRNRPRVRNDKGKSSCESIKEAPVYNAEGSSQVALGSWPRPPGSQMIRVVLMQSIPADAKKRNIEGEVTGVTMICGYFRHWRPDSRGSSKFQRLPSKA